MAPPSPSPERPPPRSRDLGLDLLRGLALLRVIVWHATSAAAVTLVAAMPVMFFVSGELFGRSAHTRGSWRTAADRLRRIGPPLWAFALVAWALMAAGAAASATTLSWRNAVWWVLPVTDPQGSAWEGGWLATPLWYLRTLLWVLALAPPALVLVRRWPRAALAAGVVVVAALEWVERGAGWRVEAAPGLLWQLGDVVLYGLFFLAGAHLSSRPVPSPRRAGVAAVVATIAAAAWWFVAPPPGGVVNDSHLTHLTVGAAVVCAALAARPLLSRIADRSVVRPVVHVLSQRSLTIYLWHTTATVVALWVVERLAIDSGLARGIAFAALIACATCVLVAATGWIEDLASRRAPALWPVHGVRSTRRARPATAHDGAPAPARSRSRPVAATLRRAAVPGLAAVVVLAAVGATVGRAPDGSATYALRVPSQAPPPPQVGSADGGWVVPTGPAVIEEDRLDEVLDDWFEDRSMSGVVVGIAAHDGTSWQRARGDGRDGGRRHVGEALDIASVTKLYTANLVYRAIDAGLIGLDDPLPSLSRVPDSPLTGRVTIRQLLSHRSGLANYRETDPFMADPRHFVDPLDAVSLSLPGDGEELTVGEARYSSTNYLMLGYLLEDLNGLGFGEILKGSLLDPIGLGRTVHLPSEPGEPRFATAGIVTDVEELARTGQALLVDHVGITDSAWTSMSEFDPEAGMGAGTLQYCPCRLDGDGRTVAFAVGYSGASTVLVRLVDLDVVIALDLTDSLWGDDGRFADVEDLLRDLAAAMVPGEVAPDDHV
jgi:CubicO group peptidase (beta-lactamase class C family)/peptidoglycan/LPS O-acetylase OafA/YrhL